MKGTIVKAIEKLVIEKLGVDKWEKCLELSGYKKNKIFLLQDDVEDADVFKIIKNLSEISGLSTQEIFDLYGDYWVNDYAPKIYTAFYNLKNAKDFILNIQKIHDIMTASMKNARPPRFEYNWKNEKELIVDYYSERNLIELAISLLKGVGKYFKENLKISKLNDKQIHVVFE